MPEPRKSRCFFVLLYPENPEYEEQLQTIKDNCPSWAYITHDKDIDDNLNVKKEHVHVVVYFDHALVINGVVRKFINTIPPERIEFCSHIKRGIRYLVHKDNPEKYQYPVESVVSNFDISRYLLGQEDEVNEITQVISRIENGEINNVSQLCKSGIQWSVLRRNYRILSDLIYYHNSLRTFLDAVEQHTHDLTNAHLQGMFDQLSDLEDKDKLKGR